jgi:hypothetical protein
MEAVKPRFKALHDNDLGHACASAVVQPAEPYFNERNGEGKVYKTRRKE